MKVTPHGAQNINGRRSAIDGRTTRHSGYGVSLRIRKRIEEAFGWIKTVAGQDKTKFRGRDRVGWVFTFLRPPSTIWCGCRSSWRDRLMARVSPFAEAFAGRWRIVEMDK
ncbi:hypothetical protein BN77_p250008 [Rhizobium mesoamericanum STM3625]|uniref:Transposase n=1 Tax=Rhizobium mesoamericanum STM3625 TaxID=1211777 RepID=K0Q6Q8_9HYPH|nr:hypothetical protein BN77_p250008 [Rhizobium mesoamericanum STM3625]